MHVVCIQYVKPKYTARRVARIQPHSGRKIVRDSSTDNTALIRVPYSRIYGYIQQFKLIFPIWVEPETDPDSQCRDYNTLRPPPVYRVVSF